MRIGEFQFGRVVFVTVEKGEDLLETVQRAVDDCGIQQGVVLCGLGVLDGASLYEVSDLNFPAAKNYENIDGAVELVAMNGNIIGGTIHMHAVVSTADGIWGGHVMAGNKSHITLQVMLAELTGDLIVRRADPAGGQSTIAFEKT